jgi:hypothetical protein
MSKVPKSKPKQKITTKRKISLIFLGIGVLVAGLLVFRATVHHEQTEKQFKQDKVRFAQTEKDMADAYAAIVQTAGQPYETKITKGCGYGALKYARGTLNCGIGYSVTYGILDVSGGKEMTLRILDAVSNVKGYVLQNTIPYEKVNLVDVLEADLISPNAMSCTFNYDIYNKDTYNNNIISIKNKKTSSAMVAVYGFICNGGAAKPLYPLSNTNK